MKLQLRDKRTGELVPWLNYYIENNGWFCQIFHESGILRVMISDAVDVRKEVTFPNPDYALELVEDETK